LYNEAVPIETSYSNLRENLATYLDKVVDDQDVVIVRRKGSRDVALIPADELSSLVETAHLLRSPANAKRLLTALKRAKGGATKPSSLEALRRDVGLDSKG
jgi:antitoxin YefM